MKEPFIHASSYIDPGALIGEETKIWHFCHIMSGASLGPRCNIGQNVFIASNVKIGANVKIQNNVSVYEGVEIEDDVFLGPSCVFTNITNPRSHVNRKNQYQRTLIGRGSTIGANATIVCGNNLGKYSLVGAGAVVTHSIPDFGVVYGNPARLKGWICRCGEGLKFSPAGDSEASTCPACGTQYLKRLESVKIKDEG